MGRRQQMIDANDVISYLEAKKGTVFALRQDVIDYVKSLAEDNGAAMEYLGEHKPTEYTDVARSWLKGIPTIEAEPERGRWTEGADGCVFCSECGTEWLSESAKYYKFCPICGARME